MSELILGFVRSVFHPRGDARLTANGEGGRGWVRSDFLFARPSFFSGVSRTLDLSGSFDAYNVSQTGGAADAKALYADWRVIGQDLVIAARKVYPDFGDCDHLDDGRVPQ